MTGDAKQFDADAVTGEVRYAAAGEDAETADPPPGVDASECPHCGAATPTDANFCPVCGGAMRGPDCAQCGSPSGGADRFCTSCGAELPGRVSRAASEAAASAPAPSGWSGKAPWAVAGVAVAGLLALALVLVLRDGVAEGGGSSTPSAGQAPPLGPTSAVDLSSMTPREAAERLFTRVMTAVEAGNSAGANLFLPMALASYDRIGVLSLDDRFHLSLLHAVAGDGAQALAVAEAGLAVRPTHLLCLAAAAEGALLLGDSATAAAHYQTFVEAYDDELRTGLTEYTSREAGHPDLLPALLAEARAYLNGG